MSEDIKQISPEAEAQHLIAMMNTIGWQILVRRYAEVREEILTEGKKARREEKTIKMWAVLEGLDKAIGLPERIIHAGQKYQDGGVEED